MQFPPDLVAGTLLRRYQRFLADIRLPDGTVVLAHCPNSGSMRGCSPPGAPVLLSRSADPARRCPYSWELVFVDGCWIGIHTGRTNGLVREALENGTIRELAGYDVIRPEVRLGESRIDFHLSGPSGECWLEVKSVTLGDHGTALFPDAVTERGRRHLRELETAVRSGARGVIFFAVQRPDCGSFAPADGIDPAYGRALREAAAAGVEILAYRSEVAPGGMRLTARIDVSL